MVSAFKFASSTSTDASLTERIDPTNKPTAAGKSSRAAITASKSISAADTARAVKAPEVIAQFPNWGAEGAGTSPEEFAKRYRDDIAFYAKLIKQASIPLID